MAADNTLFLATVQQILADADECVEMLTIVEQPGFSPEAQAFNDKVKSIITTQSFLIRAQIQHQLYVEDKLEELVKKHAPQ